MVRCIYLVHALLYYFARDALGFERFPSVGGREGGRFQDILAPEHTYICTEPLSTNMGNNDN